MQSDMTAERVTSPSSPIPAARLRSPGLSDRHQPNKGYQGGTCRCREHGRIGCPLGHEGERGGEIACIDQERPADTADDMPVTGGANRASGTAPREMVMRPFAIPNMTTNIAAADAGARAAPAARKRRAAFLLQIAQHRGDCAPRQDGSPMRARTCAGPNNAPISTAVARSMPPRPKIASDAPTTRRTKA